MLIREDYFEQNGFHTLYHRIVTPSADVTPGMIELLDEQDTLLPGILYLASDRDADAFFAARPVRISFGALLIVTDAAEVRDWPEGISIVALTDSLARTFNRLNQVLDRPVQEESVKLFGILWNRVMKSQELKTAQLAEELGRIENTTGPFARLCCVSFEDPEQTQRSCGFILRQLLPLIPNACGTVFGQEIVILQTYAERKYVIDFDTEPISAVLEKYNGYMMVSNGSRDLSSLRVLYGMTSRTLEIARNLKVIPDRVFHFERFAAYLVIDYCCSALKGANGLNHLLCTAHPGVVVLTRYDRENNDNLRDVLYFYLMNGRSVSATAERLYLHRNTIMNKVKKIQSILNVDLEDRHVRQRLIFSCQVLRYFEGMQIAQDDIPKV